MKHFYFFQRDLFTLHSRAVSTSMLWYFHWAWHQPSLLWNINLVFLSPAFLQSKLTFSWVEFCLRSRWWVHLLGYLLLCIPFFRHSSPACSRLAIFPLLQVVFGGPLCSQRLALDRLRRRGHLSFLLLSIFHFLILSVFLGGFHVWGWREWGLITLLVLRLCLCGRLLWLCYLGLNSMILICTSAWGSASCACLFLLRLGDWKVVLFESLNCIFNRDWLVLVRFMAHMSWWT